MTLRGHWFTVYSPRTTQSLAQCLTQIFVREMKGRWKEQRGQNTKKGWNKERMEARNEQRKERRKEEWLAAAWMDGMIGQEGGKKEKLDGNIAGRMNE
jgi:hypothetical protein